MLAVLPAAALCLTAREATEYFGTETLSNDATVYIEQPWELRSVSLMLLDRARVDPFHSYVEAGGEFSCSPGGVPTCADPAYVFTADSSLSRFSVPTGGDLFLYAYNCTGPLAPPRLHIYIHCSWGFLPLRRYPVLFISAAAILYDLIVAVLLIVNRCHHQSFGLVLHTLLIASAFTFLPLSALTVVLYGIANGNMRMDHLPRVCDWFAPVRNFVLLGVALCFSMGLSVIHERLALKKWVLVAADGLFFSVSQFLIASSGAIAVYVVGLVVYVLSYGAFLVLFFASMRECVAILGAHMVMLQAKGIDPEHTPTSRKMLMLNRMMLCGMLAFFAFVVSTVIGMPGVAAFWVHFLLDTVAREALFGCMCWTCRIRSKMVALYGEGEDEYRVADGELRHWTPDVILPPLPAAGFRADAVRSAPA
jgi:hypothetical protein